MHDSLASYGTMIADDVRRHAYAEALRAAIRPGDRVLDIGTGPGFFALLAARLGAGRVVGIDTTAVVELARELAASNGLADRLEFVRGRAEHFDPGERFDVIVSDLRGVLPLEGDHLATIADARSRLLAEGGVLIPQRDRLWAAPVTASAAIARHLAGFADRHDLDLAAARARLRSGRVRVALHREAVLAAPVAWACLDYRVIEDRSVTGRYTGRAGRRAEAHGVALWFDTELIPGIGFDAGPAAPETLYRQVLLPFPEAVRVEPNDRFEIDLTATRTAAGWEWTWSTAIDGATRRRFDQSTLDGMIFDPARLAKRAGTYRPHLDEAGAQLRFVLDRIDGEQTSAAIARALQRDAPARFPTAESALAFVADVASRYG